MSGPDESIPDGGDIIDIKPASRKGSHLLIEVAGGPQAGKTLTALRLARGLVGPNGRIGGLDTESGRMRLYADKIPGGFEIGELYAPYTPQRYIDAYKTFIRHGVDIIVTDSLSHVWQGVGGVLDMADSGGGKGLQKWLKPKTEYRRLVQFFLSTRMHMIFCSRAKQPVVEKTVNGKKELVTMPWEPIHDKSLKYEMTIFLPMLLNGTYETDASRFKCPEDLRPLFTGELLTEQTGEAIAAWLGGHNPIDHGAELVRLKADEAAGRGIAAFRLFWEGLSKSERAIINARRADYKSAAEAADEERARIQGGPDDDDPFPVTASGGPDPIDRTLADARSPSPIAVPIMAGREQWDAFAASIVRDARRCETTEQLAEFDALNKPSMDRCAAIRSDLADLMRSAIMEQAGKIGAE